MNRRTPMNSQEKNDSSLFLCRIIDAFVFAVLSLFPVVVTDRYYNMLVTKYFFYCGCVILLVLTSLWCVYKDAGRSVKSYFEHFKLKRFLRTFCFVDFALAAFLLIVVISTFSSKFFFESFWGNEGRLSGMFLLSLYGIAYFGVTRFGKFKRWYLDAFLTASMFVCLFGITDYFQMDILRFKAEMYERQKLIFTSTLGNINTYTAYVAMVSAVSMILFCTASDRKRWIGYYVCMVISFFAIIMGISDNAYLALGALFGLSPLYLFKTRKGVWSYFIAGTTFLTVIQCISWINVEMAEVVVGIDSVFNLIANYDKLLYIVLGLWAVMAVWYLLSRLIKWKNTEIGVWLRLIWLGMLVCAASLVIYVLYDCNIAGNADKYAGLGNYLVFNDDWGTHRGYIWRNAIECFEEFPLSKKIVGFGPDTFGILIKKRTYDNIYKEIIDNAHNEYLHYLLTVGVAGLCAYLAFVGSAIARGFRRAAADPYVIAAVFAVICYSAQAAVNLNLPIATPIMWMMLTISVLGCRESNK